MVSRRDKDYWFHKASKPPLHICVEYNTAVYLKTRKGKPAPPSGGDDGGKIEGQGA